MFVTDINFYPSLIFDIFLTECSSIKAQFWCTPALLQDVRQTSLKMFAAVKHSSLLRQCINHAKKFYKLGLGHCSNEPIPLKGHLHVQFSIAIWYQNLHCLKFCNFALWLCIVILQFYYNFELRFCIAILHCRLQMSNANSTV